MSTLVREFVDGRVEEVPAPGQSPTIVRIIKAYAELTGRLVDELTGPSKTPAISDHRHRLMYLIRQIDPAASYAMIGRYLGERDMSTVHKAVAKIASEVDRIASVSIEVGRLRDLIRTELEEPEAPPVPPVRWQILAALQVLRDDQMTDAEARKVALSFLEQLEAGHA